jgi:hypothetical protein
LRKRKAVLEVGKWADLVILIRFNANFRKWNLKYEASEHLSGGTKKVK